MNDEILFEYYPYKTDKIVKFAFRVLLFIWIVFIIVSIAMIIHGLIKKDYTELLSSLIPFVSAIGFCYLVLAYKNHKLQIYADHISIYSFSGKEKKYEVNIKLITIKVNYSKSNLKLTFLDNNASKICSYYLLETVISQKRRKKWADKLKNLGCSIEDKGQYLLDNSIYQKSIDEDITSINNENNKQSSIDDCLYIRKLLKRNSNLFPNIPLIFGVFIIGVFFILHLTGVKIESNIIFLFVVLLILQFALSMFQRRIFKKMLSYDDEKLLELEFSKRALEKRKDI